MKKSTIALFVGFLVASHAAWAKPKDKIVAEVVSIADAFRESPHFHPAVPETSTTICNPNREKCTTTTVPGHQASIDNLEYYSQFLYVVTPNGLHLRIRYLGERVVYPPSPGNYEAEMDGDKYLILYVHWADGRSGKLRYRIEGTWLTN